MKWKHRKISSLLLRVVICFLLIGSGPGGMVLCIGADGQAELKPAYHHENHNQKHGYLHGCSQLPREDEIHTEHENGQSYDQVLSEHKHYQTCEDISVFAGYVEAASPPANHLKPITHSDIVIISDIALAVETAQEVLRWYPLGGANPSLPSLRTVILLT